MLRDAASGSAVEGRRGVRFWTSRTRCIWRVSRSNRSSTVSTSKSSLFSKSVPWVKGSFRSITSCSPLAGVKEVVFTVPVEPSPPLTV